MSEGTAKISEINIIFQSLDTTTRSVLNKICFCKYI
jgi:hypothetical protein